MKLASKIAAAAVAVGLSVAAAGSADAAIIFNGTYAGPNSYIGSYNPVTNDGASFNNVTLPTGAFTNTYVFNFVGGAASVNANFNPGFPDPNSIDNFTVKLYNASAAGGCTANTTTTPGACTGLSLGAEVATGVPGQSSSNIGFTNLATGLYAFVVTGTVVSVPTQYSGQMNTRVPEPATLALLGAGLLGLGVARRRKAQAAA